MSEEYKSVGEFLLGKGEVDEIPQKPEVGEKYSIGFISNHGKHKTIILELKDHMKEYCTMETENGVRYQIMGFGLSDREKGEIVRYGEKRKMKIGMFEEARQI